MTTEVGTVIAGKLRVEQMLGRGGMGVVVIATHLQLGQRVAVKVMRDDLGGDRTNVERLLREGQASARLKSEHVCRVFDVGTLESGAPYLVMELLEGTDLAAVIAQRRLSIAETVDYVLQACEAIGEAHANGIVHRDLKPANLFVARRLDGSATIKVLDFGIAKAGDDLQLTQTAAMMGSPAFMSPEQLRSARDVDGRTDIWALGAILYQCVSGRLPFPASSVTELTAKVLLESPEPLRIEPRFDAIVARCLEKDRERRYPTVLALAQDLAALVATTAPGTAASTIATLSTLPPPSTIAPARSYRSFYIAGGAAVALIAVAAIASSSGHHDDAPAPVVMRDPGPGAVASDNMAKFTRGIVEHNCADALDAAKALGQANLVQQAENCVPIKAKLYPRTLAGAQAAAAGHDLAQALAIAEGLLEKKPDDPSLLLFAGLTACEGHQPDKARRYVPRIAASERDFVISQCRQLGISIP